MTLSVSSTFGMPGDTVQVTVDISDNPGVASLKFDVMYDEMLTLVDVEFNSAFGSMVTTPEPYSNPQPITMISPLVDVTANGVFATLTFKVREDAPDGYLAKVAVQYNPEDIFDGADRQILVSVTDGGVSVLHGMPGDIDGNKSVNTKDAIALFRYVAGWNVEVDVNALDVNGDKNVNTKDAIALFRYVAGWEGIILHYGTTLHVHELTKVDAVAPTYTTPGNIAYWRCNSCGALFADEKTQQPIREEDTVIAPLQSYEIRYDLYDQNSTYLEKVGVKNPNPTVYDPNSGLILQDLEAEGYAFQGWYDDNGNRVREIPMGTAGLVGLSAKWAPKTYTLTMRDLVNDSKTISFTPESTFELETPVWRHLSFSHWEDSSQKLTPYTDGNGVARLRLEQGTVGDIEVVAKWRNPLNQVKNNTADSTLIGSKYEEEEQLYWFVYELGKIERVILGEKTDYPAINHVGGERELSHTKQVSITEEMGTSLSEMSASVVSKSEGWSKTTEEMVTNSKTYGSSVKTGIETEFGIDWANVKTSIEGEIHADIGEEESHGLSSTRDTSETITEENSKEVTNNFVYAKTLDYSTTDTTKLTADDPTGTYRNVNAATMTVYGIVVYDPATMTYYLETYTVISDTYLYLLYERDGYVDYAEDSIEYRVDVDAVEEEVRSKYYIQYDAYEGDEKMPIVRMENDVPGTLCDDFTRTGYTLVGWTYIDDEGVEQLVNVKPGVPTEVAPLVDAGKTVTLQAVWEANNYSVEYNANGGNGFMGPLQCVYDVPSHLTANAFERAGYTFLGWSKDPDAVTAEYMDEAAILNMTDITGEVVWLYAVWSANTYTITFDSNGGSAVSAITKEFDSAYGEMTVPTKKNYGFIGWALNGEIVTAETLVSVPANHTLVAQWVKTYTYIAFEKGENERDKKMWKDASFEETICPEFDPDALRANGYTKITVKISFDGIGIMLFGTENTACVQLFSCSGKELYYYERSDHYDYFNWETETCTIDVALDDLGEDGSFVVRWSTKGDSDDGWWLGETEYFITAVK
ncbi:MAG: InlB B-repeat-containing protein [Clostridia bacterium]|nr:InlB B-repeat-containing protein [Clostridia bacterium]